MTVPATALTTAAVRALLDARIRSDADLSAFLLDYFPGVYRRIGAGMNRVEKVNLLLEQEPDLEQIVRRLSERFPDAPGFGPVLPARAPRWPLALLLAAGLLAVALATWVIWQRASPRTAAPDAPRPTRPDEPAGSPARALPPARQAASPAPVPAAPAMLPAAPACAAGSLNASCNSIQAGPGSQIRINAKQTR